MSNNSNTALLERAQEAIDSAQELIENWSGTMVANILNVHVAQVTKDLDTNDLENLHKQTLPILERSIEETEEGMEGMVTQRDIERADQYLDQLRDDGIKSR